MFLDVDGLWQRRIYRPVCVLYIVVNKCINYNLGFDTVQVGLGLNTAR